MHLGFRLLALCYQSHRNNPVILGSLPKTWHSFVSDHGYWHRMKSAQKDLIDTQYWNESTLVHEIFATLLFRDFKVRTFRDT